MMSADDDDDVGIFISFLNPLLILIISHNNNINIY